MVTGGIQAFDGVVQCLIFVSSLLVRIAVVVAVVAVAAVVVVVFFVEFVFS